MENPAPLPDPFAEERKEYERTIEDLFDKLAESERYSKVAMEELFAKLAESEEDRTSAAERAMDEEAQRRIADDRWRRVVDDLGAQFDKERVEYLKTIEDLLDKLAKVEPKITEAKNQKLEAEERCFSQIRETKEFEGLYKEECRKRKCTEDELARCKEKLEECRKRESIKEELARCKQELEECRKKFIEEELAKGKEESE